MYTRVAAWATSATPLPMWSVEGSGMVLLPNMVTDFRDTFLQMVVVQIFHMARVPLCCSNNRHDCLSWAITAVSLVCQRESSSRCWLRQLGRSKFAPGFVMT
jgi:hypothetical protein